MSALVLVVFLIQVVIISQQNVTAIPVAAVNANCPVPTTSAEFGTTKVLNLDEIKGKKVRLQFFYPKEDVSKRLLESMEATTTTTLSPAGTIMYRARMAKAGNNSSVEAGSGEAVDADGSLEADADMYTHDIFCQWTFKVAR